MRTWRLRPVNNRESDCVKERGGAPRNPAPGRHFWGGLSNHEQSVCKTPALQSLAGCACETDRRVSTPLRSTSPFPELGDSNPTTIESLTEPEA